MKNIDDALVTSNTYQYLPFYGNKPCVDMILKLISNESISQSLIFSGPSGLGKFTLSYKLALHILHDGCKTLKKTKDINANVNDDILKLHPARGDDFSILLTPLQLCCVFGWVSILNRQIKPCQVVWEN